MEHKQFFKLFVLSFLVLLSFKLLPVACIDLTRSNGIIPTLHATEPASRVIKSGETIIDTPGSYHLLEDIEGYIHIKESNVLLNLNGFTIKGLPGYNQPIFVFPDQKLTEVVTKENITIMNGIIEASENFYGITLRSVKQRCMVSKW